MNISGVSSTGLSALMQQVQNSQNQSQNAATTKSVTHDGDGDHGHESGKGRFINVRA